MKTWVVYSPHIFTAFEANYLSVLDKLFSTFNNPFFQKKMELFVLLPEMHCLNPFLPDALFWSPWKHQGKHFCFQGDQNGALGRKGLTKCLCFQKRYSEDLYISENLKSCCFWWFQSESFWSINGRVRTEIQMMILAWN